MAKQIILFRTAEQFIKWINEVFPKDAGDRRTVEEYAAWAICLQEAHTLSDSFSTKDIASLFMDGISAYRANPVASIQQWLDTINEDFLFAAEEDNIDLPEDNLVSVEVAEEYGLSNVAALVANDYGSTDEEKEQFD